MRARGFDSVLEVYELTQKKTELYSEIIAEYIPKGTIRADRVKNDGRRTIILGEQYSLYTAEYYIRDGNIVKEGWRVKDLGSGITYEVVSSIHDREKRMRAIKCERVNPNEDADRP